ncbi:MAG TPA: MBOAT family O-acyltransferase [Kofleriaceae bacterium]|jgi:alginate O-acetyltransferase complex protein AlgI
MIFSSIPFLIFLPILLGLVWLARTELQRRVLIFVASLVFYGWWDWRFCFFLVAASTIDYRLALEIQAAPTRAQKKKWLALSVCSNLGILAIFKYAGWLVRSVNALTGADLPVPHLPLPLGISFFTFQAMSYTIDVYREQFNPTKRWFDFSFSMSFFPHLISGPIVRASHFMPQLAAEHPLRSDQLLDGLQLFAKGFLKKTLLADQLAVCADAIFVDPSFYSSGACWLGVAAYTLQIYYDFSGYTDMAIGLARMFGFQFPQNFDHPYLSTDLAEFWRRWHISLSSWLRDYLYISLGGNRRGAARTYVNLMITMLLGGLWHGANWTFVVWGALHGVGLAAHRLWSKLLPAPGPIRRALGLPATLLFVMIGWVFFRAPTFAIAGTVLRKLAFVDTIGATWPYVQAIVVITAAIGAHAWVASGRKLGFDLRRPVFVALLIFALALALLYNPAVHSPFIYFQF